MTDRSSLMTVSQILIYTHIVMGTVALLAGAGAMIFRKGASLHRKAGNIFFISMLIMAGLGAHGALYVPETISVITGIFTCYLVSTGWVASKRKKKTVGIFEKLACLVGISVSCAYFYFGFEALNRTEGHVDGFSPEPHFIFGAIALWASVLDLILLKNGGVIGVQRVLRHLGRMTFAFLLAATSLFLGQAQVFPEPLQEVFFLGLPVLAILGALIYWFIKVRFSKLYRKARKIPQTKMSP